MCCVFARGNVAVAALVQKSGREDCHKREERVYLCVYVRERERERERESLKNKYERLRREKAKERQQRAGRSEERAYSDIASS